ncbi:MAG: gliding motility-associated C-terminal domain-containing protein [Crocinitomicaceae bacterium]|nr:gliding motility-associated C-terminal domain-containing protein [Crocinitomicaceae bacterium]
MRARLLTVILFIFSFTFVSRASHIMGGEITWTCLGSGNYEFKLVLYRDCNGLDIIDPTLDIEVWGHPSVTTISTTLTEQVDLSPNCTEVTGSPAELECGTGTGAGTGPGAIEKYVYTSAAVSLPGTPPAEGWKFTYDSFSRNWDLTNIATPATYGLTLWSVMYPIPGATPGTCIDDSPQFAQDPYVIMCEGTDFAYDPNCFDPNNDDLAFSWGIPYDHFPSGAFDPPVNPIPVPFTAGFSATNPTPDASFDAGNVPASMDSESGVISFTSNTVGNFGLVQKIDASRDGQVIATVNRELQMIVIPCPGYVNTAPTITPPFGGGTTFEAEFFAGDLINFDIEIEDLEFLQDGTPQTVTLVPSGAYFGDGFTDPAMGCDYLPCATLSTAPVISGVQGLTTTFNWQTSCDHLLDASGVQAEEQTYSFVLNAQDDYCQVPGRTFETIRITLKNRAIIDGVDLHCVDVRDDGSVELTWGKTTDSGGSFDSYEVWSLEDGFITSITDINQETYVHVAAAADISSKNYFVLTKFGCGGLNELSSDTLETMFMNLNDMGDGRINLTWNDTHDPINFGDNTNQDILREYPVATSVVRGTVLYASNFFLDTIDICSAFQSYEISVDNSFGCVSTSNKVGAVLDDQINPLIPEMHWVSVDTASGLAELGWNINPAEDTYGYIIYQQQFGVWVPIDTVWGRFNNTFINPASLASSETEAYRVAAFDSCFTAVVPPTYQTSAFSDFHRTMLVENDYNICDKSISLSWTAYEGWVEGIREYEIVVKVAGSPFETIATVPSTQTTYTHTNLYYDADYCYFIKAISNNDTLSFSNQVCQFTDRPAQAAFHYLSTATHNLNNEIELKLYTDGAAAVDHYEVLRRGPWDDYFEVIGEITPDGTNNLSYFDSDIFSERGSYRYQVNIIDTCGNIGAESNIARTVYTTVTTDHVRMLNTLSWSAYTGFDGSITGYAVYRGENGIFPSTPIETTLPGVRSYVDDVSAFFDSEGQFCYRVEAIESSNTFGFAETSFSNNVCATIEPVVYIPNAFVVNGANPVFLPVVSLYEFSSYQLIIYDRWGGEIFMTTDPDEGWNGEGNTLMGDRLPQGVYVYFLSFNDRNGDVYEYRGTVTMLFDE